MIRNFNGSLKFYPFSHIRTLILLFLSLFIFSSTAIAANHYIRADATGNGSGSDWSNAWTSMPSTYTRGDTYYVADGNYSAPDLNTASSGSTYINIKKATASSHGTDTGWNNSYGDGRAYFTGTWKLRTDYWDIDGVTGSGKSGHGFYTTTNASTADSKLMYVYNGADYLNIKHMEMEHVGESTGTYRQDIFYCVIGDDNGASNITMSYCYLHNVNRVHIYLNQSQNCTFEHNYFANRYNADHYGLHGESVTCNGNKNPGNITFRYNVFENCEGTGIIVIKDSVQSYFYIYGNVFFRTGGTHYDTTNGSISNTTNDTNTHMYVFNNTFVNLAGVTGVSWRGSESGNVARNNLWVNCDKVFLSGQSEASHNIQNGSPSLFVNYNGNNFQLAQPTDSGYSLGEQFDEDMNGNIRGADGNWDIGAYEYNAGGSGGGGGDDKPDPPTGVKIITQ